MPAQESTPPLVVAEVTQPVPTPGTAEVLLSPTPAVQTPAGRMTSGDDLQWTGGTMGARESAAAPATAAVLAAVGPLQDAASSVLEMAPTAAPAQATAGDETCMAETLALTSTVAVQLQYSVSAAVSGLDTTVAAEAARAHAIEEACGGACSRPPVADRGSLQAAGVAAAAAVCAPLAAEDSADAADHVLTTGADDLKASLEAGMVAAIASASHPVPAVEEEPGADVLYSSAMIAAVADGIASKLQVCFLLGPCMQMLENNAACHQTSRRALRPLSFALANKRALTRSSAALQLQYLPCCCQPWRCCDRSARLLLHSMRASRIVSRSRSRCRSAPLPPSLRVSGSLTTT